MDICFGGIREGFESGCETREKDEGRCWVMDGLSQGSKRHYGSGRDFGWAKGWAQGCEGGGLFCYAYCFEICDSSG